MCNWAYNGMTDAGYEITCDTYNTDCGRKDVAFERNQMNKYEFMFCPYCGEPISLED